MVTEQPVANAAGAVREIRARSGLSQRGLADASGTSGPTVAAYEKERVEPRLSTLTRLADAAGLRVELRVRSADPGEAARERRERRSRGLGSALALAAEQDWPAARALALENLDRLELAVGANASRRVLDDWRRTIEAGPADVRAALVATGERAHDLRQLNPFAGLLTDRERRLALAAASPE